MIEAQKSATAYSFLIVKVKCFFLMAFDNLENFSTFFIFVEKIKK